MVFELLVSAKDAESKPFEMFFYGIIITTVSLFAAYYIFPSSSSVIFLFLLTIAAFPTISAILKDDEEIDEMNQRSGLSFFAHYERTIMVYSYLFLGVLVTVSFWYTVLPETYTSYLFSQQTSTIESIRVSGAATSSATFWMILFNNLKVTTIAFLMSFFFGTGAIFILSWNASVIGVFVSDLAREFSSRYSYSLLQGHIDALLSISIHGVPEIVAYFIAGIAGGILSIGMIRGRKDFKIAKDAGSLYLISALILVFAAFLEVWVTPYL